MNINELAKEVHENAVNHGWWEKAGACKPEGIAVELADVILRTLDLMAALGVDVDAVVMAKHRYNLGREYRHGGKRI